MLIHLIRIRVSLVYFPHRRAWSEWCDCRCHRTFSAQVPPPTLICFQSIRKGNFSGLFYMFTGFSLTSSNLFQQMIDCWRIEIQMESIWISDEPSREPFLSVWTSQKNLLSFLVNLQNQTHREEEHSSENDSPWALSHMNEPWNQDDEFKLQRIASGWDFLFSSTAAVYLIY